MKFVHVAIASTFILSACGGAKDTSGDTSPSSAPEAEAQEFAPPAPGPRETSANNSSSNPYESSIILAEPDGVTQLTWEDLMPLGEEEVLTKLYEEYYSDLRKSMEAQSQLLKDAQAIDENGKSIDISMLIAEGSAYDTMEQIGTFNVVDDLDGLEIRMPGYVVPLDFSANGSYDEFLLVPYFGACLHTPPPPPNQIVYVRAESPAEVKSIYDPVWVEGIMKTGKYENDLGNSAYELTLSKMEPYEY